LGFVAAHGATAAVTFKLRRERDPLRIRALLELSRSTRELMYGSFLLMVAAGTAAAFQAHWWSSRWLWTAIGLLVVLFGAAFPLAVPYFRAIRRAVETEPVDRDGLDRLLRQPRLVVLAVVETLGIVAILFLMVMKPF
jgi:hypothetical protein